MHCDATPLTTNQQSKKVRNPIQSRPDRQTKKRMDSMWMQNDEDDTMMMELKMKMKTKKNCVKLNGITVL